MRSDLYKIDFGRKKANVLFNDPLNTFYLRLYGVGHLVKDLSDRNPLPPLHGLLHGLDLLQALSHNQDSTFH